MHRQVLKPAMMAIRIRPMPAATTVKQRLVVMVFAEKIYPPTIRDMKRVMMGISILVMVVMWIAALRAAVTVMWMKASSATMVMR